MSRRPNNPPPNEPKRPAARVKFSERVQVILAPGDAGPDADRRTPGQSRPREEAATEDGSGLVVITAWVNGVPLVSQRLTSEAVGSVLSLDLFSEPTRIFGAMAPNESDPHYFRAELHAVLMDNRDLARALEFLRSNKPNEARLEACAHGFVGLGLGARWCPVRERLGIEKPPAMAQDLDYWTAEADYAFNAFFFPDPSVAAERLLASVPGIGGCLGELTP